MPSYVIKKYWILDIDHYCYQAKIRLVDGFSCKTIIFENCYN
jgi:hypothetical protein